jgi:hypothetical protein
MQLAEPHTWILVLEVPVSPTDISFVLLHAGRASLQRVIGAKTAGQETQSVFQVGHMMATHHCKAIRN